MRGDEQLDPSVRDFKAFVQQHPELVREVRAGRATWNGLYQDWVVVGEDERHWVSLKGSENEVNSSDTSLPEVVEESNSNRFNSNQTIASLMKSLGQMNINDVQKYLSQFSGVMGNVQELLNQFQSRTDHTRNDRRENPFSFRGF